MYLIFDTETTGLPKDFNAPITDGDNWPRVVQIAWQLHDDMGKLVEQKDFLVKPEGFNIPFGSEQIHGISTDLATQEGADLTEVLQAFNEVLQKADFIVGHNVRFDQNIMAAEFYRKGIDNTLTEISMLDTATEKTANLCQLPGGRGGRYKLPKLGELYHHIFHTDFKEAHNATADVEATARIFLELIRTGLFTEEELQKPAGYLKEFKQVNPAPFQPIGLKHQNLKKRSEAIRKASQAQIADVESADILTDVGFVHLHNHTQYSVLQSTVKLKQLVEKTAAYGMPAVAVTDVDNMMGSFLFVSAVDAFNKNNEPDKHIKPIIGIELRVVDDHNDRTKQDNGFPTVFLAKNKKGYQNLIKLASAAHTQGFYYVPRIGRDWVEKYKGDLIVLSGHLGGEVSSKILSLGDKQAEEALLWWKNLFGEDYYLEIMRHDLEEENRVNQVLIELSKKHNVGLVATNNTFYLEQSDADAQDVLLCIKDNEKKSTPIGRGRGFRYGLPNNEFYYKSPEQMKALFKDLPEAIKNTVLIADKIESFPLKRDILIPKYDIPDDLGDTLDQYKTADTTDEDAYLKYLTYEGAKKRWDVITPEIQERLDYELGVIISEKFPGYFLIVQDIIKAAKRMGVMCGPGRGSAAGSAVAYVLEITNVDPIKYQLLFERFLNPDRVSMPDIDMDFDDEGREKVIQYVVDKYGKERVSQIITYGTMAAKSAIRDAARVMEFPLPETDKLAKKAHVSLDFIINKNEEKIKEKAKRAELIQDAMELVKISEGTDQAAHTVQTAGKLEGSLRNLGMHACGFIIAPVPLDEVVPITTGKGSDMYVTQFDNSVVESAGLLKMDFLGIKTLTIIRDAMQLIKEHRGIEIDLDNLPLDDAKTYQLFQRGQTVTVFQFESDGMRKSLMALRPTNFEDLVSMVALYRPGPMEKIPSFIARKHGKEEVVYDLPEMEEYLKATYGITIYQEQVMLLSQKLAGFTGAQADSLRKAMGKKLHDLLATLHPLFIEGALKNGHPREIIDKIWEEWQSFASYAFNRSHAVSYAIISYQTAYLKANYPSEYMAAVLSHNLKDAKKLSFLMTETRKMGIEVLPPDINESNYYYTVNKAGNIRYGLGGASGVGESAVSAIIEERKNNGAFQSFFSFIKRVNLRSVNKRTIENLIMAGAFDCFEGTHRAQYFQMSGDSNFIEKAIKFGTRYKKNLESMQTSLFGASEDVQIPEPDIPECEPWSELQKLQKEKEVTGIYLSGHPLDSMATAYRHYVTKDIQFVNEMIQVLSGNKEEEVVQEGEELMESEEEKAEKQLAYKKFEQLLGRDIVIGGMVSGIRTFETKKGTAGNLSIEDYSDNISLNLWSTDYLKYSMYFVKNIFVLARIKIFRPFYDPKQIKVSISDIGLLSEVFDKLPKDLLIVLRVDNTNRDLVDNIYEILSQKKGNSKLKIRLLDIEDAQLGFETQSQALHFKLTKEMVEALEKQKIPFKLV